MTEMTKEQARDIVTDMAARWGENFEEQFVRRVEADTSDELCEEIANLSAMDVEDVTETRDLWKAIEVLRAPDARLSDALDALRKIVSQEGYEGFGDPASRAAWVERVAVDALAKAGAR